MSGQKPREIAAQVLGQRSGGKFIEELLNEALRPAALGPEDRRLCQELVYGVVRWQATLDWLIARKTSSRSQKRALQELLRLGLYQIFWLERIPNHAAVHETVEQAKQSGFGPQSGFINALLRGYLREFDATRELLIDLKERQPALGYSHPEWLTVRWEQLWGKKAAAQLMDWNNTPPKTFARVNTLKTEPGPLLTQWRAENIEYDFVRRDWLPENLVFELESHPPLDRLPSFRQGLFYVQDPSTLLAVRELDPHPGETVLDLCAAPGGKLSYIAQLMNNEGRLFAYDHRPERLRLIRENCARLGITCLQILEQLALPTSRFDKILVDAPCSNTGVMRRRVDLRWRILPGEIRRLRAAQLNLLRNAAVLLQPSGLLVYSTCSLEPEENEQVIREFLRNHAEFALDRTQELQPFKHSVDGAYVACLVRREVTVAVG